MTKLAVVIKPTFHTTRLLMKCGDDEVLKAVLPPASQMHWRAVPTLLEGLALWFGRRLSVALCVDEKDDSSGLSLCDALGYGRSALHYEVEVLEPGQRRGRRLNGVDSFRDLRQLHLRFR